MSDFICCACYKYLDETPYMLCEENHICGNCYKRGFLKSGDESPSSKFGICPDCQKDVTHDVSHINPDNFVRKQMKEKKIACEVCNKMLFVCEMRTHCADNHPNSKMEEQRKNLAEEADDKEICPEGGELNEPPEREVVEEQRWCPYKQEYGCTFWGTHPEIQRHVHYNECLGKRLTDYMFLLEQLRQCTCRIVEWKDARGG